VGTGPELGRLQQIAPPNVRFTGWVSDEKAIELIAGAKGFLQASKEDFGISAVEAQGYGVAVLAYGQGGAAETVVGQAHASPTGLLFDELEAEAVAQRILEFERHRFLPEDCRRNAARFSPQAFEAAIAEQLKPFGIHLEVRSF
jgi:glycosyltransferase involved in cell wall biosynthesis